MGTGLLSVMVCNLFLLPPDDVQTSFEKSKWRNTVREAIMAAMAEDAYPSGHVKSAYLDINSPFRVKFSEQ